MTWLTYYHGLSCDKVLKYISSIPGKPCEKESWHGIRCESKGTYLSLCFFAKPKGCKLLDFFFVCHFKNYLDRRHYSSLQISYAFTQLLTSLWKQFSWTRLGDVICPSCHNISELRLMHQVHCFCINASKHSATIYIHSSHHRPQVTA